MAKERPDSESRKDAHKLQDLEIEHTLNQIKNKILVMSGKGGVGKSSVAAYISVVLARKGYKVGLMDVDLHGPSIPRLLGLKGTIKPGAMPGKAGPVRYMPNMEVISIESLMGEKKDVATIWRGPLKIGVIKQFISDIEWSDLDFLIIDSPPGTGDEPLTVAQTIPDAMAVVVTTPQEISLADVRKSINFCRQVNMHILGLVENMSGLQCPYCGKLINIFKKNGGSITAQKERLKLLGALPLQPEVVNNGDIGSMKFLDNDQLPFTMEFNKMVDEIIKSVENRKKVSLKSKKVNASDTGKKVMKGVKVFVIPVSDGKLSSHFGHCEQFAFVETENGRIMDKYEKTPPSRDPGVIPAWMYEQGADVVIAGGIGDRAEQLLREKGVEVISGAPMDAPELLVNQYLADTLISGNNICDH
ncbi:MAG: chromosome partitioning protein ParA [Desulfobacteraceae bacterium 4484_190.1]|nr:MAG: chromosome partitioning protein ParA [Desulfobacteraceae bacterium 4484_190.1]